MSDKTERVDADRAYGEDVGQAWDHHLRVARLLTGDPHRAEELLQDCLVKLYTRWHRMSWHQNPDAYLRSMLANGNVSWWRRRRREHLVAESPERADPGASPRPVDLVAVSATSTRYAIDTSQCVRMLGAVSTLSSATCQCAAAGTPRIGGARG